MSPGSVYCWYPSKESIVDAVAEERHRHEREHLETALRAADPRTALTGFLDVYFTWLADPREQRRRRVGILVWAESLVSERMRPAVRAGIDQRGLAADAVRAGQAAGTIAAGVDPDTVTRLILAVIQGFILQQSRDPDLDPATYRRALDSLTP
ncbi:TetR/AcrR family transcriptional regulator [Nocardia panacis]|uniref:TetR/AcrR family transcriptional regulator n=1 Tax=Nocardia panacis TaxID=2340916 RepID=UPI00131530F8|nr:TetR family transcriptional regulator C-terminal domain-containing protein [Nocardia panacis]